MQRILDQLSSVFVKLTPMAVLDILVVSLFIYIFIINIRGRRAAQIASGMLILLCAYLASVWLQLELLRTLLATLAPYSAFAIIVMFQSEIRRVLARIGRTRIFTFGGRLQRRETAEEILMALNYLTQHRIGALIVVERDIGLKTFVETGVNLDARLSRDLLLSIFYPGGALHDGAAIVQGDRIAAAACFLPLSMNPARLGHLGTRHRAAIGITEETDSLAIVVSEETGHISLCAFGEIQHGVSIEYVEDQITKHLSQPLAPPISENSQMEIRRS
ncbi:MAG: TIGR00159 family protein [Acidobacteria bacterium]|nr:TIGR00159 family protein [Acidobacteriota bacterium]